MPFFQCFACQKVTPIVGKDSDACPSCGSAKGQLVTKQRVKEGMGAGVFFNIDPRTGKRKKNKKR